MYHLVSRLIDRGSYLPRNDGGLEGSGLVGFCLRLPGFRLSGLRLLG